MWPVWVDIWIWGKRQHTHAHIENTQKRIGAVQAFSRWTGDCFISAFLTVFPPSDIVQAAFLSLCKPSKNRWVLPFFLWCHILSDRHAEKSERHLEVNDSGPVLFATYTGSCQTSRTHRSGYWALWTSNLFGVSRPTATFYIYVEAEEMQVYSGAYSKCHQLQPGFLRSTWESAEILHVVTESVSQHSRIHVWTIYTSVKHL